MKPSRDQQKVETGFCARSGLKIKGLIVTVLAAAFSLSALTVLAADAPKRPYPKHELDPTWPKQFPNNMIMGDPAGVAVDPSNDHVWVLSRQRNVNPEWLGLTKSPPTSVHVLPRPTRWGR